MLKDLRIHPRERLNCAMEMLSGARVVADVGCDHGRLACALVQSGAAEKCVAIDVSADSLEKARRLAERVGVSDRVETRLGDGLTPLASNEADALAILGMGGTLMTRILEAPAIPLGGAEICVLQPMRAAEDIRRWLYERNYPVVDDRVVLESGRLYQVFAVSQPETARQTLPEGWPEGFFALGYTALAKCEPLFEPLARRMLATAERKLKTQRSAALERQAEDLKTILRLWEARA